MPGLSRAALSAALIVGMMGACADAPSAAGDAEPRRLYDRLQDEDYRSWMAVPGFEMRAASSSPHGELAQIYINDVMVTALGLEELEAWPEGALLVEDGWADAESDELEYVAAMEKRGSTWYWASFDADGEPLVFGEKISCVSCHQNGADFVRTLELPVLEEGEAG